MSALPSIITAAQTLLAQQVARLAVNAPTAALLLLPASTRAIVTALQNLPEMRAQLQREWDRHNNTIETNWSHLTPAQGAQLDARMKEHRRYLDSATAALATIDTYIGRARGILAATGIPVPTIPGLGALPAVGVAIIIVAAALGGSVLLATFATFSRDLAAGSRVMLGFDPAPPPGAAVQNAGIGIGAIVAAAALLFFVMKGKK